ncbi:hypothetical protein TNCV_4881721 [Trichonephila clavipes]|nr:hypothetical protein TNCV_4881721 [Trichonephila clavipes]
MSFHWSSAIIWRREMHAHGSSSSLDLVWPRYLSSHSREFVAGVVELRVRVPVQLKIHRVERRMHVNSVELKNPSISMFHLRT